MPKTSSTNPLSWMPITTGSTSGSGTVTLPAGWTVTGTGTVATGSGWYSGTISTGSAWISPSTWSSTAVWTYFGVKPTVWDELSPEGREALLLGMYDFLARWAWGGYPGPLRLKPRNPYAIVYGKSGLAIKTTTTTTAATGSVSASFFEDSS